MATIEFDWNGEESSGFTLLPKGTYAVQIDNYEVGQSSNGNPQLKVKGRVVGHPQYDQQKVTIWYSLLPQSGWKLIRLLDACGVDFEAPDVQLPNGETGKKVRFEGDDLIGCYVRYEVSVSKNPKNDKPKNDFENEEAYDPTGGQAQQGQGQAQSQVQGPHGQAYPAYPQGGVPQQQQYPQQQQQPMQGYPQQQPMQQQPMQQQPMQQQPMQQQPMQGQPMQQPAQQGGPSGRRGRRGQQVQG